MAENSGVEKNDSPEAGMESFRAEIQAIKDAEMEKKERGETFRPEFKNINDIKALGMAEREVYQRVKSEDPLLTMDEFVRLRTARFEEVEALPSSSEEDSRRLQSIGSFWSYVFILLNSRLSMESVKELRRKKLSAFQNEMMSVLGITGEQSLLLGSEEMDYYRKFLGSTLIDQELHDVRGYGSEAGHMDDPDLESRRVKELFWNWLGNRQNIRSMAEQVKADKLNRGGQ